MEKLHGIYAAPLFLLGLSPRQVGNKLEGSNDCNAAMCGFATSCVPRTLSMHKECRGERHAACSSTPATHVSADDSLSLCSWSTLREASLLRVGRAITGKGQGLTLHSCWTFRLDHLLRRTLRSSNLGRSPSASVPRFVSCQCHRWAARLARRLDWKPARLAPQRIRPSPDSARSLHKSPALRIDIGCNSELATPTDLNA